MFRMFVLGIALYLVIQSNYEKMKIRRNPQLSGLLYMIWFFCINLIILLSYQELKPSSLQKKGIPDACWYQEYGVLSDTRIILARCYSDWDSV